MNRTCTVLTCAAAMAGAVALPACEDKKPPAPSTVGTVPKPGAHPDHAGPVIQLGAAKIGPFDVLATRDARQINPGGDAAIDVTVTAAPGSAVKAAAVRLWIGTDDVKGSVKAKAEIEDPAEPGRWHTHVEVPRPIPAGCRLWVEIEDDQGGRAVGGFDLKV